MKILLISPLPPPEGGIAIWTKKYRDYCEHKGIELEIVNTAVVGKRAAQITARSTLADEIKRTYGILRSLRKALKNGADIVHLNSSCTGLGIYRDLICAEMVSKAKIPLILHCRCNIDDQLQDKPEAIRVFTRMAKLSDKVLSLNKSSFMYADAIVPGKVITVPNFAEDSSINESFCVRPQIKTAVFVGHVIKTKGAMEIFEVAKHFHDIKFQLIGPVEDDIRSLAESDNIQFVGKLPSNKVRPYLEKADIFLFPTYTEGFSNALMEAMACGLPVITTPVGANEDMIEDKGGIIVQVGDTKAIISAIKELHSQKIREEMSCFNMQKVRNTYMIDSVMKKLLDIYIKTID